MLLGIFALRGIFALHQAEVVVFVLYLLFLIKIHLLVSLIQELLQFAVQVALGDLRAVSGACVYCGWGRVS